MAITNTTLASPTYNGNGVTTAFATSFQFLDQEDLRVVVTATDGTETIQTLTTDYTVTGANNPSGGTVTFVSAPASGTRINILSDVTIDQQTDYLEGGSFAADTHERALDKLTKIAQQLQEQIDRSLTLAPVDGGIETQTAEAEAGYILRVNTAGAGLEWIDPLNAALAGDLTPTNDGFVVGNGTGFVVETGATARGSMGLGSIATQAASAVAITGGTVAGVTVGGLTIGTNAGGNRTISTSTPTGGSNGDIWYRY